MGKFCGTLKVGAVQGGGVVGTQTLRNDRVVTSFEVPVAIEYELSVGATHFSRIRCCEQAMAPFVAQNNGNEVCIYTFRQLPRTAVMLAVVSEEGPSYRMSAGRLRATLITHVGFLPALLLLPMLLFRTFGLLLLAVVLYFSARNGMELWSSWHQMQKDGGAVHG